MLVLDLLCVRPPAVALIELGDRHADGPLVDLDEVADMPRGAAA